MQPLTEPRKLEPIELAVGLGLALAYTAVFLHWKLVVDDAFISFRYAEHLRRLGELVYNPGERVEGFSSLSWTLILALLGAVGLGPERAAMALGYLAGLGTLLLVRHVARATLGLGSLAASWAVALCAINPSFSFWAASGLETPLFAGLLLASSVLFVGASTVPGAIRAGLCALLLGVTRPEGVLLAVFMLVVLPPRTAPARVFVTLALAVSLPLGALELWRHAYYGAFWPNAVQAKAGWSLPLLIRGARYLWAFLTDERVLFLLPLGLLGRRGTPASRGLNLVLAGYALFIVGVGGDGLYRYRLAAHALPLLALAVASGFERVLGSRPRLGVVLGCASVAVLFEPLMERDFFAHQPLVVVRGWEARWTRVGQALHRAVPPEATLATNVAGRVPFFSGLRTLDLLGLTDPVIARSPTDEIGRGYAGHERAAPDYVLSRRPDLVYLSVLDGLPAELLRDPRSAELVLRSGSLWRYAPLLGGEGWRRAYRPALLRLGDGSTAGLFVRRGSSTERAAGGPLTLLE